MTRRHIDPQTRDVWDGWIIALAASALFWIATGWVS